MNKKKVFITLGLVIGVIFLTVFAYGVYLYKSVTDTAKEIHEPFIPTRDIDLNDQEPISFLLAGVDSTGDEHAGRSDTIIVMTVNPNERSIKMLSIPRDTRTEIIGRGTQDKINHAYAFGGVQMTADTVSNFLDIPIDHYISINMEGMKNLVDAVGGVKVDNAFAFSQDGFSFAEGEIYLNGDEALAYARMRKQDPRGDFGRNDRQRQIVEAVIQEAAHFGTITKAGSVLDAVGNSVRTDMTLDHMWRIQSNYRDARHHVDQMEIKGNNTTINGIYYLQIPDEELARVRSELRTHMELE
ncbi:LCP family glycopolymer transferase [Halalkalibacter krulwichiae]|uniref:Polyisoprenyl-teichoic acid--peptidoglycan teichoic acid transferase TagU n=1 Tax=Halalkalibacter krulwichiae TaxID=199441 RepID=A0A1X9MHS9_9BACI|nr:LCP family protein [Halalkalibacter krulwichiae]ARK32224.1 Transcriptional regulator LytR [Halalkalibacter krulwichiae]